MKKRRMTSLVALLVLVSCCVNLSAYAAASETGLDEATKQAYYAEYVKIAKEAAQETNLDITVLPMDEFTEEDWRTPEEFRRVVTDIANWNPVFTDWKVTDFDVVSSSERGTPITATKPTQVTVREFTRDIAVTGSFWTQYNLLRERQLFEGIGSITSEMSGRHNGTWTQTGYDSELIDAGRTYAVHVFGEWTFAGTKFSDVVAYTEFYCNEVGAVT